MSTTGELHRDDIRWSLHADPLRAELLDLSGLPPSVHMVIATWLQDDLDAVRVAYHETLTQLHEAHRQQERDTHRIDALLLDLRTARQQLQTLQRETPR